jgi:hypothetical protein
LFLKEGAAEITALGEGEFELLVEIVNPIPAVTGVLGTMRKGCQKRRSP